MILLLTKCSGSSFPSHCYSFFTHETHLISCHIGHYESAPEYITGHGFFFSVISISTTGSCQV